MRVAETDVCFLFLAWLLCSTCHENCYRCIIFFGSRDQDMTLSYSKRLFFWLQRCLLWFSFQPWFGLVQALSATSKIQQGRKKINYRSILFPTLIMTLAGWKLSTSIFMAQIIPFSTLECSTFWTLLSLSWVQTGQSDLFTWKLRSSSAGGKSKTEPCVGKWGNWLKRKGWSL